MSVYGTYLHVIGVIIKMRPAFVSNLRPQRAERRDLITALVSQTLEKSIDLKRRHLKYIMYVRNMRKLGRKCLAEKSLRVFVCVVEL